jgi:cyanophycinase
VYQSNQNRMTFTGNRVVQALAGPFCRKVFAAVLAGALLPWGMRAAPAAAPITPLVPRAAHADPAGALVIVGGGGLPDSVRDRFLELAGGRKARLVIIPTASFNADSKHLLKSYTYWKSYGVASVELLHTRQREQANNPAFCKPLAEATAVWLSGGDQANLEAAYHGTAVERELQKVLARGGVIGGTSAGAAVMGDLMIRGGNPRADVGPGFGLLRGVVVDQHFTERKRMPRLLGALEKHPDYLGLGIDENTAAVVKGHTLTALGNAQVQVCSPSPGKKPNVRVLKSGEGVDLVPRWPTTRAHAEHASAKEVAAKEAPDRPRAAGESGRATGSVYPGAIPFSPPTPLLPLPRVHPR